MVRDSFYWEEVRRVAHELGTDGCTKATDWYVECCWEHDIHYILGRTLSGAPLTKSQADKIFRRCIQDRSPFGRFSPMSWWRWLGVKLFGRGIWSKQTNDGDESVS